jgi:hypothetical protein
MGPASGGVAAVVPASIAPIVSGASGAGRTVVSGDDRSAPRSRNAGEETSGAQLADVSLESDAGEGPSVEVWRREPEHAKANVQMRYGRFFLVMAGNGTSNCLESCSRIGAASDRGHLHSGNACGYSQPAFGAGLAYRPTTLRLAARQSHAIATVTERQLPSFGLPELAVVLASLA